MSSTLSIRRSSGPPGGGSRARLKAGTPPEAPTPAPTTKTPIPTTVDRSVPKLSLTFHVRFLSVGASHLPCYHWEGKAYTQNNDRRYIVPNCSTEQ